MQKLNLLILLSCFISSVNGQTPVQSPNFTSIDHIPIVVKNIKSVKKILSEILHFKVKEGKEHEGIKNCFIKFQDGTYLEFITPTDSLQSIGKYYTDFLKNRQGGTSLAISVKSADTIINFLKAKNIQVEIDSNRIWKTVEPKGFDLFFIDYSDKNWKDSKTNTAHLNEALSLKSTYIIDTDQNLYAKKYKVLGFSENKKGTFSGIPCKALQIGQSNLYFFSSSTTKRISSKLKSQIFFGICGFEIKVGSLKKIRKLVPKSENVIIEKRKIIYFFSENNFFLEFTE
jgi:Glyoxalase-like domain